VKPWVADLREVSGRVDDEERVSEVVVLLERTHADADPEGHLRMRCRLLPPGKDVWIAMTCVLVTAAALGVQWLFDEGRVESRARELIGASRGEVHDRYFRRATIANCDVDAAGGCDGHPCRNLLGEHLHAELQLAPNKVSYCLVFDDRDLLVRVERMGLMPTP
jgi:hypothetical protein